MTEAMSPGEFMDKWVTRLGLRDHKEFQDDMTKLDEYFYRRYFRVSDDILGH